MRIRDYKNSASGSSPNYLFLFFKKTHIPIILFLLAYIISSYIIPRVHRVHIILDLGFITNEYESKKINKNQHLKLKIHNYKKFPNAYKLLKLIYYCSLGM